MPDGWFRLVICRSLEVFGVTGFLFSLWLHEGEYPDDFPADSDHDSRNVEDKPMVNKFFAFFADFVHGYAGYSLNELEGRSETLCLSSVIDEQGSSGREQSDVSRRISEHGRLILKTVLRSSLIMDGWRG